MTWDSRQHKLVTYKKESLFKKDGKDIDDSYDVMDDSLNEDKIKGFQKNIDAKELAKKIRTRLISKRNKMHEQNFIKFV